MGLLRKEAQSLGEYVVLLALAASVIAGMQVYVKRGLQGRIRDTSDGLIISMHRSLNLDSPTPAQRQFEPSYSVRSRDTSNSASLLERMFRGGGVRREFPEDTTVTGLAEETVICKNANCE